MSQFKDTMVSYKPELTIEPVSIIVKEMVYFDEYHSKIHKTTPNENRPSARKNFMSHQYIIN